jgi:amino acid adenylation domain-containing protein
MDYVETGLEIAVTGMAGRFPGAKDIAEYWDNLKNGVESVSYLSEEELSRAGVEPGLIDHPGYVKTRGGVLEGIDYFDAAFFNYSPIEAEQMAPQVRLFHECAWAALEDAGCDPERYPRPIGLYMGVSSTHHWELLSESSLDSGGQETYSSYYLNNRDFLSTLTAYKLNLKGPALFMHTTCSTSLVSIHLACQGLLSGDCDMALAGGIAVRLAENKGYLYEEGMVLSPDGHCRAFDAGAMGTVGGDGAGVVTLKRLEDALEDRDHIYAVIKGSAINNDGSRKVGYAAPSIEGQASVIRKALSMAEVKPEDIGYIEAHGTATALGDVTEVEALKQAFKTDKKHFCGLGSVKSNFGHLGEAAGAAGFIKTVLALKHKCIPPSLHYQTPNPRIDFENSPFYVNTTLKPWQSNGGPLRAGVSSFGIGGTNAHVILEAPLRGESIKDKGNGDYLILLSAKSPHALDQMTQNLIKHIENNPAHPGHPGTDIRDIAYTLQVGRRHFSYRRKLVCSSAVEAVEKLSAPASREVQTYAAETDEGKKKVVFMFPGLGPQYVDMGKGIYHNEPVFREAVDRCSGILEPLTGYDIKEIIFPGETSLNDIHDTHDTHDIRRFDVAQLVIFVFEYALATLLMHWGIRPYAMIGYSFGEYAAACLAGVFELEDILKLLVVRGKLIAALPPGRMLTAPLPEEEVEPLLPEDLAIAIDNGPSCVVSGAVETVGLFERRMKEKRLICMPLPAGHALHSPMMDPVLEEFEREAAGITLNPPRFPYISTVTGTWIKSEDAVSPAYWRRQMRERVCFAGGMKQLLRETGTVFIETGPGRDISALVNREIEKTSNCHAVNLVKNRESNKETADDRYLLDRLGLLWLYGVDIDWEKLYPVEKPRRVPLPTYPFESRRFRKLVDQMGKGDAVLRAAAPPAPDREKELADCFYMLAWKQTAPPLLLNRQPEEPGGSGWLIFTGDEQEGEEALLVEELKAYDAGEMVYTVSRGKEFSRVGEDGFIIEPSSKDNYDRLVPFLLERGTFPGSILYLWELGDEAPDRFDRGYFSLLYLLQALAAHGVAKKLGDMEAGTGSLRIDVVLSGVYAVTGEERLQAEKAAILGLCKTIPQEYPNIICRSIDMPGGGGMLKWRELLFAELSAPPGEGSLVVAYRGNTRWVQGVESLKLEAVDGHPPVLKEKGVYLITGGLGNDSFERAKYLAEYFKARLVLTGRTPLPERSYWNQYRMLHGKDDKAGIKVTRIMELEQLGAEVLPISADVSDELDMRSVMQEIDRRFGRLDGVIHAAGETGVESARLLADLGVEESNLHFKPKVHGLYVLEKVLEGRELDFCLLTSSVVSVIGGVGLSAYTAASIFMDVFARRHNREKPVPWLSLNWEGASPENTVEAFKRVLLLRAVDQVLFCGEDLERLIDERTKLKPGMAAFTGDGEPDYMYSRPELSTPYEAPTDETERKLADIWQRFFGIEKIGIDDDLFDLGGDSLKAINILSILQKELKADIPITEFFDRPTIRGSAAYLREHGGGEHRVIELSELKEYYAASSAQKRMYLFQQMNPESTAYNTPLARLIEGEVDKVKMEEVFSKLIERHESLRTTIELINGEPIQRIHPIDVVKSKVFGSPEPFFQKGFWPPEALREFVKPFDMGRAPFLRVELVEVGEREYLLLLDMHHIIADGVSMGIFIDEFMALYETWELPELRVQYKEYAEWQSRELGSEGAAGQEAYWLELFGEGVPVLDLPLDYARPRERDFRGSSVTFGVGIDETGKIKELALEEGATLFVVLLAIYNIFLAKICGQEEIVVGAPTAGRFHADFERVMGMFINTLALKNAPRGSLNVREFLREVKESTFTAFANQDYQYDELVERLPVSANVNRGSGRNPLFDTMLMLQNLEIPEFEISGLKMKTYDFDWGGSKFDLTLLGMEIEEDLSFTFEYNSNLFKRETVERFAGYFKTVISEVAGDPDRPVWGIDVLSEGEKQRLLVEFNDTAEEFPAEKTICELFEELTDRIPDHSALLFRDRVVTFREFDERSNRLAHYLSESKGVRVGDRVAVSMERSIELIVTLMGVMKAGAAYVPLDPSLPVERLRIVFEDACIGVAVSQEKFKETLSQVQARCGGFHGLVYMDNIDLGGYSASRLPGNGGADGPAYVMYTSGSSGTPKGVLVEHRTIVNTLIWRKNYYEYQPGNVSLQNPPYFFDSSVTDIFTPLLGGARLVLIAEAERIDLEVLKHVIRDFHVSHFIVVPAFYNILLEEIGDYLTGLKKICVAGEHFPDELVKKHFQRLPHVRIVNEYGPTENSVNTTEYELAPESVKALIGKPISNVQVYVLDRYLCLVPIGVTGEICLGGSSLARGYLNNPELTEEKFVTSTMHLPHRFYRTGDLGRWDMDGNLEFMGRLDTQVKIRGMRIEVGEIENRLMRHDDVREVIVVVREGGGDEKYLCAYVVGDGSEAILKEYLAAWLPDYMAPSAIIFIDAIPFTASGKIDREGLPEPEMSEAGEELKAARNKIEEILVGIWAGVLEVEPDGIGIDSDFFRLGGNSLKAARMASRIHKAFDVRIPLAGIFKAPSIRKIAAAVSSAEAHVFLDIEAVEEREYYGLSYNQRRLWVISQLEPGATAYHMPGRVDLEHRVDESAVKRAIALVVERHESLRTGFKTINVNGKEKPVQFVLPPQELEPVIATFDLSAMDDGRQERELARVLDEDAAKAFDLGRPPLLRFVLVKLVDDLYCLGFTMHHIITDGFSLEILKTDFMTLYDSSRRGEPVSLQRLELQYKDFAEWQGRGFEDPEIKERAHAFWRGVLEKELAAVSLPVGSVDGGDSREGASYRFTISGEVKDRLNVLAQTYHTSLFTVVLALFNILLSRVSGQKDILVGLPVSGRDHVSLQQIVGFFVNTVILDSHVQEDLPFESFLEQVNKNVLEVLQHQGYPLELVLDDLHMPFPPVNVFFNMLNLDDSGLERELVSFEPCHQDESVEVKFDLMMYVTEYKNGMELFCNYKKTVFRPETIASIMERYVKIIEFFSMNPGKRMVDFKRKKRSLKKSK